MSKQKPDFGPLFQSAHKHRCAVVRDTTLNAYEAIQPRAGSIREKVFKFIYDRGAEGTTSEELQNAMGLKQNTANPRLRELAQAQRVMDSGRRRLTESGRSAIVWVAAEQPGNTF